MQTQPPITQYSLNIISTPIRISTLVKDTIKVFGKSPLIFFLLTIVLNIPFITFHLFFPTNEVVTRYGKIGYLISLNVIKCIDYIFWLILSIFIILLVDRIVANGAWIFPDILRDFQQRFFPALLTECWVFLIIAFLMILIIPGIISMNTLIFTLPITVLRGISGKQAMDRSETLVNGRWWKVLGYNFLPILLSFSISAVLQHQARGITENQVLFQLMISIIHAIVSTLGTIYFTLFFLKLDYQQADIIETVLPSDDQPTTQPIASAANSE